MSAVGSILRWVHILSGAAWLGAVVRVVFVIVPSLVRLDEPERGSFAATVLPRVFRLASVLSVTVVAAGAALYLERFDWKLQLEPLVTGRWGWSILVGGSLALLLTSLRDWRRSQIMNRIRAGAAWEDGDWVVTDEMGVALRPDRLSKEFRRTIEGHELRRIPFRQLRHTHATALLMSGAHPKVVQERLGHSSVSVTLDTYSAVLPIMQMHAIEDLARMFDAG